MAPRSILSVAHCKRHTWQSRLPKPAAPLQNARFPVGFQGRPQVRGKEEMKAEGFCTELNESHEHATELREKQRLGWKESSQSRYLSAVGQEDCWGGEQHLGKP